MKPHVSYDGGESIPSGIVGCSLFPTMGTTKKMGPIGFKGWPQMQWVKLKVKGWRRSNLVHNTKEKTFEVQQKDEMIK
jgi:hypothetical protein